MAAGEILATSKFYVEIDGYPDLIIKSVSGVSATLEVAGADMSYGVTKGGKSTVQATVTGVSNANITITFVGTSDDKSMYDWYYASHSTEYVGGGSESGGERKSASIVLYNQAGEEAARWNLTGVFPVSYKGSQLSAEDAALYEETLDFAYENLARVS
ncbi:phage tail protein [Spirulina sp. CS-785/01]|uniref:phage tail protein n=1 Tax=Spirulina sp. CS-785/01 TaxID=3021716 RepID=UPI00232B14F7|nr:phage tail protein [Spirulina sp. CS-785/01]MDB9314574.1 phage tail protein [Spirulina sp. CS-785/01]